MSHSLICVPRPWSWADRLRSHLFPRRAATVPAAAWLGELMQRRFGALILCQPCLWRYGEVVRRFGYARHPDMRSRGGRCDGCKQTYDLLPILIAEEKRGRSEVTRAQMDAEHRRRRAPVPELLRV